MVDGLPALASTPETNQLPQHHGLERHPRMSWSKWCCGTRSLPLLVCLTLLGMQHLQAAPYMPPPGLALQQQQDWTALNAGLRYNDTGGINFGLYSLYGPSFPVLRSGAKMPVVAATRFGQGRVVAYGHEAVYSMVFPQTSTLARFARNALNWAANVTSRSSSSPARVAYASVQFDTVVGAIVSEFPSQLSLYDPTQASGVLPLSDFLSGGSRYVDIYLATIYDASYSDSDVLQLVKWVKGGGSLLLGGQCWWWGQQAANRNLSPITAFPGNKLLAQFGFLFTSTFGDSSQMNPSMPTFSRLGNQDQPPSPPYLGPFDPVPPPSPPPSFDSTPSAPPPFFDLSPELGGVPTQASPPRSRPPPPSPPPPPPPSPPPPSPSGMPPADLAWLQQVQSDWQAMTQGTPLVSGASSSGVPSPLLLFDDAFPVLRLPADGSTIVAASRLGEGRVVHVGHESLVFNTAFLPASFWVKLAAWASRAQEAQGRKLRVAARDSSLSFYTFMLQQAAPDMFEVYPPGLPAPPLPLANLSTSVADLYLTTTNMDDLAPDQVGLLVDFVKQGGGLVSAGQTWWWQLQHPQQDALVDCNTNKLLQSFGMLSSPHAAALGPSTFFLGPANSTALPRTALALLLSQAKGEAALDLATLGRARDLLVPVIRATPLSLFPSFWSRLSELQQALGPRGLAGPGATLNSASAVFAPGVVAVTASVRKALAPDPAMVEASPSAELFPGLPDANASVARDVALVMSGTFELPPGLKTVSYGSSVWRSTGLYAPPGATVNLYLPPQVVASGDLSVQIGCHTDQLWGEEGWVRAPQVVSVHPVTNQTVQQHEGYALMQVANGFGGLLYLVVSSGSSLGPFLMVVDGAMRAPRFVKDVTDLQEWRDSIRYHPAPWAELEASGFILSLPSASLRDLDNPQELLEFYDRVVDAQADLANMSHVRPRPERMVMDAQITIGVAHSGYPLMATPFLTSQLLNMNGLREAGAWVMFHELGHQHQQLWFQDLVVSGSVVEVTPNWFAAYCMDTLTNASDSGWWTPEAKAGLVRDWMALPARDMEQWDTYTGFAMYLQLRDVLGWGFYKRLHGLYLEDPPAEFMRLKSDGEKRNKFVTRSCDVAGADLGPYFIAWGFNDLTNQTLSICAQLGEWQLNPLAVHQGSSNSTSPPPSPPPPHRSNSTRVRRSNRSSTASKSSSSGSSSSNKSVGTDRRIFV